MYLEIEKRKIAVKICLRKWRGGSEASLHVLRTRVMRKAPKAKRRQAGWDESKSFKVNMET